MAWPPKPPFDDGRYKKGKPRIPKWEWRNYSLERGWGKGKRKVYRRRAVRQKPWNKTPRHEKVWVPSVMMDQQGNNPFVLDGSLAMTPQYIAAYRAQELLGEGAVGTSPTGSKLRALQTGKLWRFQGHLWAWLDPSIDLHEPAWYDDTVSPGGADVTPNVKMLTYIWLKVKQDANSQNQAGIPDAAALAPNPTQDLAVLLQRDDLISWGTIPVFGIVPRMLSAMGQGDAGVPQYSWLVGNAGMYMQQHIAKVPWPRLPKTGLNLRQGEVLACIASVWPGPSGGTTPYNKPVNAGDRDVIVVDVSRALVSE